MIEFIDSRETERGSWAGRFVVRDRMYLVEIDSSGTRVFLFCSADFRLKLVKKLPLAKTPELALKICLKL